MLDTGLQEPRPLEDQELQYAWDVLGLEAQEDEDALDERLRTEAEELGLRSNGLSSSVQESTKAPSVDTVVSEHARRSGSICSETSQSTGLTSHYSDVSRDKSAAALQHRALVLQTFDDHYAHMNGRSFAGKQGFQQYTPPHNPAQSTPALAESIESKSPKKHFRRLRGLNMLRLYRSDSAASITDRCSHCPRDFASQRRAVHRLPCGHRLCTVALRTVVITAEERMVLPSCCGMAVQEKMVNEVMPETVHAVSQYQTQALDDAASRPSSPTHRTVNSVDTESGRSSAFSDICGKDSIAQSVAKAVDLVLQTPEYHRFRAEQESQRDRFKNWAQAVQSALEVQHKVLYDILQQVHETSQDALSSEHSLALTEAEDRQVRAESDMREAHAHEQRTNATALKHMEAYCAGRYSTGEPHHRIITDKDRAELEKTRRNRDSMSSRHASQINVLRGEQSRRIRIRIQRQEKEVLDLERQHRQQELELNQKCSAELGSSRRQEEEKRGRLLARWKLQEMILMKRCGVDEDLLESCVLPSVDWDTCLSKPVLEDTSVGALRTRYDSMLADGPECA